MKTPDTCPECGGRNLQRSVPTSAMGGYGPDLLPGLSKWFSGATFVAVVCSDCGLARYYVTRETLDRIKDSKKWRPVR